MIYSLILVNKPVIDSDRNEKMGRIKRYVIDPDDKRILAFILAPDPGQTALEIIPYSCVKSVYNNAVIVRNLPRPIKMSDAPEIMRVFMKDVTLIGSQVLTDTGMLAGSIRDFAFREKDGALVRLSLLSEKPDGPAAVGAKHILKIVKARIMISALGLKEQPDEEEEQEAPEYSPGRSAETPAGDSPVKKSPEKKPGKETVAPPAEEKPAVIETTESKPAVEEAVPAAAGADDTLQVEMMELLRQLFQELSSILMARLNSLDVKTALDATKAEIIEALKGGGDGGQQEDLSTLEILVEEKIKRGAGRHLEEIKGTLSALSETIGGMATGGEPAGPDPALAEIRGAVEKLESGMRDLAARIDTENKAEKIISLMKAEIDALRAEAPDAEDIKKSIMDQLGGQDQALKDLRGKLDEAVGQVKASVASAGKGVEKDALKEMLDALAGGIQSAMPVKELKEGLAKLTAELADLKKNVAEQIQGSRELYSKEVKGLMESRAVPEASGPVLDEEKIRGLLAELGASITTAVSSGGLKEEFGKLSQDVHAWKKSVSDELDKSRERYGVEVRSLLESRISESADRETKREDRITDLVRKLDNRIIELREQHNSTIEKMDADRNAILDEVKTFTESVMKPEDLIIIQKWLEEAKKDGPDFERLSEDINNAVDSFRTSIIESGGATASLAEMVSSLRESLSEKIDAVSGSVGARVDESMGRLDSLKDFSGEAAKLVKGEAAAAFGEAREELMRNLDERVGKILSEQSARLEEFQKHVERTVLKPSDLSAVRTWLEDLKAESKSVDSVAGEVSATVDGMKTGMQELGELLAKINDAVSAISDSVPGKMDDTARELSAQLRGAIDDIRGDEAAKEATLAELRIELADKLDDVVSRIAADFELLKKDSSEKDNVVAEIGRDISGRLDALAAKLAGDLDARLDKKMADQAGRMEKLQEQYEATVRQLRDGFKENFESRLKDFARVGDIETLREKVEEKVGDITDNFVERIEKQLDERDDEMEKGFQSILKRIEKALQKSGGRPDIGNIFGGGGLLDGIFGGGERSESQARIPSSTARGAARSAPASAGDIEDSQIRRLAYLIGKKLRQDISDAEGNTLAGEGDVVNEEMIRLMRDKHCTLSLIRGVDFS